jgi:hypothetical protein
MAILANTLTCPNCGHTEREAMPDDRCIYFWECPQCAVLLQPEERDCCV